MNVFTFELKKIFFSKRFLWLTIILVIGILLLFLRNYMFQNEILKEGLREIDAQISKTQENARSHRIVLEQVSDDEEEQQKEAINLEIRDQLYHLVTNFEKNDWVQNLRLQNDIWQKTISYREQGGEAMLSIEEMEENIAFNEELIRRGIAPEHAVYSIASPNFTKQIMDIWIHGGALFLLLVVVGETMAVEFEQHSIKLLFTQPLSKKLVVLSKFGTALSTYIVLLIITFLTAGGISLVVGEKGSWNYPVMIANQDAIEFMSISSYMLKSGTMTSILALFTIALLIFYSLYMKKIYPTFIALIATFALGYAITSVMDWQVLRWFNPFINIWPSKTLLGAYSASWYGAIPVTLLLTVLIYLASVQKMKKSYIES